MHDSAKDNLIKMANDISAYFAGFPDRAAGVGGMSEHLAKFWEPRMREAIIVHLREGGEGLSDLAKDAIRCLTQDSAPTQ